MTQESSHRASQGAASGQSALSISLPQDGMAAMSSAGTISAPTPTGSRSTPSPARGVTARQARSAAEFVAPALTEAEAEPSIQSLSFVIPARNEEGNLGELHARLSEVLASIGLPYELILIDDGSNDGTWALMRQLHASDPHVSAIRHRRNFGKAQALAYGFAMARSDVVVTMDADLQDDPAELPKFLAKLDEGYDLVSGWKQRRKDPLGKTFPSKVFNRTVRLASGVQLHDFNCGYKAYRREVTQAIRLYGELHRFTPVLANAQGFRIGELPVRHHARRWGTSKYGWSRLVKGFLDLITVVFLTQYRQRPMHLFGLPGLMALGIGVLIGLWLSADKLITGSAIGTRPLLLLAVLLVVLGAQFFGLGLLGEYLAHGSASPKTTVDLQPMIRETLGAEPREALHPANPASPADPASLTSS